MYLARCIFYATHIFTFAKPTFRSSFCFSLFGLHAYKLRCNHRHVVTICQYCLHISVSFHLFILFDFVSVFFFFLLDCRLPFWHERNWLEHIRFCAIVVSKINVHLDVIAFVVLCAFMPMSMQLNGNTIRRWSLSLNLLANAYFWYEFDGNYWERIQHRHHI